MVRTKSQRLESESTLIYQRTSSPSPSSGTQDSACRVQGWTRDNPRPHAQERRSKGHSAKSCCGPRSLLGKLAGVCQEVTFWGA